MENYDNTMPSNIIMIIAGGFSHPAVRFGLFNHNYLLFGEVMDSIYIKLEIGTADE